MVATVNRVDARINGNGKHSINGQPGINGKTVSPVPLEPVSDGKEGQRNPSGQFAVGNKCGKGNPHARKLSAMRKAFADVVDENRLKQLAESIYHRSLAGDMVAAKLLLNYVVGKPVDSVDPDRLDLEEWKLIQQSPTQGELMALVGLTANPAVAADLVANDQPTTPFAQMKSVQQVLDSGGGNDLVLCQEAVRDYRHHRKE
jgi:hypothetical protein